MIPDERFTDLRRLASIEATLDRLPLLPSDEGISAVRFSLHHERTAIVARLAAKASIQA